MWWTTFLFKPPGLWAVMAVVLFFWRTGQPAGRRTAFGLFIANLFAVPFELFVKPFFGRVRPSFALADARVLYEATSPSFPSGHALVAFGCAAVLWRHDRRLGAVAYGLAVLICLSRVYVGNHWPSDVLAGAVIGWGLGQGALRLADWLPARRPLG